MMIFNETDNRFYLADSTVPGAGQGLFSNVILEPGDRIEVLGCLILPDSESDRCTAYADAYKLRFDGKLLIPFGFAGMVNHSEIPNLEKTIDNGKFYFSATRIIKAKEELFIQYSNYAIERFLSSK